VTRAVEHSGIVLRPYQREAVSAVLESLQGGSTLAVMPTGSGKTRVFSKVIQERLRLGRVMVVAHREELIRQAARTIANVTGETPGIEKASERADAGFYTSNVVVASVQTLVAGSGNWRRMHRFDPQDFATLIFDEAHHAPARSYRTVAGHFSQNPDLGILGVTATPDRADEKAMGQVFDSVSYVYEIDDAIGDGWLVPVMQRMVHIHGLDFSQIRTTARDLNGKDLATVLEYESNLHGIAGPTLDICGDRRTLVFAVTVAQAERLAEILNRYKPNAARVVHGKTHRDERAEMFRDYATGRFQFLVNVGVAVEGFDEPGIECVVMARPTKSRALYSQMAGRGTRPLPGVVDGLDTEEDRRASIARSAKPCCEIIDFVGNAGRHKLMTCADILSGKYDDEIIELAAREAREAGRPVDMVRQLEKAAQRHTILQREKQEAERRAGVKAKARYSTTEINAFDIFDITPERTRGWDKGQPPTDRQIEILKANGINPRGLNRRQASQLIDKIFGRRAHGWCSFKQAQVLKRAGIDPTGIRFSEASTAIDQIVSNGWKATPELLEKYAKK